MQQTSGLRHVVDVGRRTDHAVHQARFGAMPMFALHSKHYCLLLVVHVGVALAVGVFVELGVATGRVDDRAQAGNHKTHTRVRERMSVVEASFSR